MTTVNHSRWAATALICASMMTIAACTEDDLGGEPLTQFDLQAEWKPIWDDPAVEPPDKVDEPDVLDIYLDISRPMGGFLPLRADSASNEFRTVAQWVPDHLIRLYGRPAVDLRWRSVGKEIGDLPDSPRLDRALFVETETRLDLAIEDMLANLRAGRAEGAALITDLVSTGESTGAIPVAKYLDKAGWLAWEDVRSGQFHLGLIGVMSSYPGATHPQVCPEKDGLGCCFSERRRGYQRLDTVAAMPFYILLIGTGADNVTEFASSITQDAKSHGIKARWEPLTAQSTPIRSKISCTAFRLNGSERKDQYALFRDADGRYQCKRNDSIQLDCGVDSETLRPQEASVLPGAGDPQQHFQAEIDDAGIRATVNCEALRQQRPVPSLRLNLKAKPEPGDAAVRWEDWSTETDESCHAGKTLQLKYFIEEVRLRPDHYQADLTLLLGH